MPDRVMGLAQNLDRSDRWMIRAFQYSGSCFANVDRWGEDRYLSCHLNILAKLFTLVILDNLKIEIHVRADVPANVIRGII